MALPVNHAYIIPVESIKIPCVAFNFNNGSSRPKPGAIEVEVVFRCAFFGPDYAAITPRWSATILFLWHQGQSAMSIPSSLFSHEQGYAQKDDVHELFAESTLASDYHCEPHIFE